MDRHSHHHTGTVFTFNGRQERVRQAAASQINPSPVKPTRLRHDVGGESTHFAWGPDFGIGGLFDDSLTVLHPGGQMRY